MKQKLVLGLKYPFSTNICIVAICLKKGKFMFVDIGDGINLFER